MHVNISFDLEDSPESRSVLSKLTSAVTKQEGVDLTSINVRVSAPDEPMAFSRLITERLRDTVRGTPFEYLMS